MSTTEHPKLMDHEYDGIQEYDNPTPGWWHAIFVSTIIFAMFYLLFWHGSPLAWSIEDSWQAAQVAEYQRIFGQIGDLNPDEPTILKMVRDEKMMSVAQGMFIGNCAACHGQAGTGIVGPNLTDDYYKNIKVVMDVFNVITKGAANGAMPTWEQRLTQNERVLLAAYVVSLRGSGGGAGKAPEGDRIAPWPPAPTMPPTSTTPAPAAAPSADAAKK